ncbi:MAG: PEP-CTERM sorting domain-containing protein [Bryobacterales bacterium]|nr:PEP-CTERM sorting domain-containing protein [Bryobacterales bacterium]
MFKRPGVGSGRVSLLVALGGLLLASSLPAAVVGQFSGNNPGSIWAGSGNFSTIYGAALASGHGHTIETPEQITAQSLANNSHFIISNPVGGVSEINALINWVNGGGILMLFVDGQSSGSSIGLVNSILSAFGPGASGNSLQVSTSQLLDPSITFQLTAAALAGSDAAVGNLAGFSISMFNPLGVSGGSSLAINLLGSALRVDSFNLGKIYVFGDNFASNQNLGNIGFGNPGMTNQQFFLNLLAQGSNGNGGGGGSGGGGDAPEPGTIGVITAGLAALAWRARKRVR